MSKTAAAPAPTHPTLPPVVRRRHRAWRNQLTAEERVRKAQAARAFRRQLRALSWEHLKDTNWRIKWCAPAGLYQTDEHLKAT